MFYAYVRQLPMVEGNLDLIRGDRLEYSCGSIRRAKADTWGFRAYVLEDKVRGVTYRVNQHGVVVETPSGPIAVPNPGELKHTPFAMTGHAGEINAFLTLCNNFVVEHKKRNSLFARLRRFTRKPFGMILIAGAVVYTIVTVIVLFFG